MVTLALNRTGRGLYPADGLAEADIRTLPAHVELRAEVTQPRRSIPQLRLYWAVLQLVSENMDRPIARATLHQWVKLRCGIIDDVVLRSGEIVEVPGSIAIESMDQPRFNEFFDQAMTAICDGLTTAGRVELIAEAEAMLDRADGH